MSLHNVNYAHVGRPWRETSEQFKLLVSLSRGFFIKSQILKDTPTQELVFLGEVFSNLLQIFANILTLHRLVAGNILLLQVLSVLSFLKNCVPSL